MKTLITFALFLLSALCVTAEDLNFDIPEAELRALEGKYTFNPSDTDEMAIVQVKFRRPTEREGAENDEWRADGTMHNSFHGTVVTFKGAVVYKDGNDVVVYGQFFGFRLKKGVLNWLENYGRELYQEENRDTEQDMMRR